MSKKQSNKKRILKHLGSVGMAALSFSLMAPSASAIDPAEAAGQVVASEGGKAALNSLAPGRLHEHTAWQASRSALQTNL